MLSAAVAGYFVASCMATLMRLSMLAPTRDRVGNFPCLEWQACPRDRDIESLKCACETHTACVHVFRQDLNSNVARWVGQLNSNSVKSPAAPPPPGGGVGANIDKQRLAIS